MSQHHRNLGIPVGATKTEIKKAYRRLAMKLHPDKNPSPNAEALFDELQKSYDALMDPNYSIRPSRSTSSARQHAKSHTTTRTKQKSKAETVQEARRKHQAKMAQQKASDERYYQSLVGGWRGKYVNIGAKLCFVLLIALLCDVVLPTHIVADQITSYSKTSEKGLKFPNVHTIFTADYGNATIAKGNYSLLRYNPELYLEKTRLLHLPINILHPVNGKIYRYPFDRHTWSIMPVPILILLVPIFILFYKRRTVYFTGAYLAACYMVIPLAIIFLLRDDRWLHLITLGFI